MTVFRARDGRNIPPAVQMLGFDIIDWAAIDWAAAARCAGRGW